MRELINLVTEGEVTPFRRPAVADRFPMMRQLANDIPDFEARYVRAADGFPYGMDHTDNLDAATAAVRAQLERNPSVNQGLDGIDYVEFVPKTAAASEWLAARHSPENPKLYGKLAVIDLTNKIKRAGLTVHRMLVWD